MMMDKLTAWITEAGCECLQSGDGPVRVMPHKCEETGFTVGLVAAPELAAMQADIAMLRKTEQRLRAQLESAKVLIAGLDRRALAHGIERAELAAKAADVAGERAANAALTAELEQRQRPLTEYEVDLLWMQRAELHDGELMPQLRDFARAIEAAHAETRRK